MDFTTLLRFIHIFSAIFWMGTTLFMLFFLEPVIQRAGQAGGQVMQLLAGTTRFPQVIALSGILTVLAGLLMYWRLYGFDPGIMFGARLPLTLGALAGFLAVITGFAFQNRAVKQLVALGAELAAQNGPPSPAQMGQMQAHQARIALGTRIAGVLMIIAVIGMVM
ncbi:MAG: hypothetical protein D6775_03070 [Caldilineae bacterium]|nr:MAG: hypothetical protein D6775_03070 [Caldilineae bacterium]